MTHAAPAHVKQVARHILNTVGEPMSTMKLQKLCYFAQGWTLAWTEGLPLFSEDFQAWRNGPVCRELWEAHRRLYSVSASDLPPLSRPLVKWQADATEAAIEPYLGLSGLQLSELTHRKGPWLDARGGLPENAPSTAVIPKASMQAFFQELSAVI